MGSEVQWFEKPLGEVTFNHDGKRKPVKESERKRGSYPYYGASGIVDYVDGYLFEGRHLLIAEDGENLRTRQTPIAFMAEGKFWVNNHAHIVTGNGEVTTEYLHYFLQNADIQSYLTGAVMPKLTQGNLNKIPVRYPEPYYQKLIVRVLGALDAKIDLNRRINQNLEAIAQAIFRSWFFDFDPVKAKMAAIQDGSDPLRAAISAISGKSDAEIDALPPEYYDQLAATAALFPDEMEESELGEIPKGWEVVRLGDHLSTLETGSRPKGGVGGIAGGVPSVGAENIIGVGKYNFGKEKFVTREFFEKMKRGKVEDFDILLYKDGGKPGEFKPRVSFFGCGFPYDEFAINEHVFRIRSETIGQPFLYFQIGSERVLAELSHKGAKAAIPGINQGDVASIRFVKPHVSAVAEFNKIIQKNLKLILKQAKESQRLAAVRDALLPKLLSGELIASALTESVGFE